MRESLHDILCTKKLASLIKISLKGIQNKVRIEGVFQLSRLKQEHASPPQPLFNFALEHAIKKIQKRYLGLDMNVQVMLT